MCDGSILSTWNGFFDLSVNGVESASLPPPHRTHSFSALFSKWLYFSCANIYRVNSYEIAFIVTSINSRISAKSWWKWLIGSQISHHIFYNCWLSTRTNKMNTAHHWWIYQTFILKMWNRYDSQRRSKRPWHNPLCFTSSFFFCSSSFNGAQNNFQIISCDKRLEFCVYTLT